VEEYHRSIIKVLAEEHQKFKKCCQNQVSTTGFFYTDLDRLSNRVPTLIDQGRLDEAEEVCQELQRQYPDQIDGISRLAEVYEARGDQKEAAEYYRKAAEFAGTTEGFDEEAVKNYLNDAHRMERQS
jgi:tetratricopeptide (TPR) repeat protein